MIIFFYFNILIFIFNFKRQFLKLLNNYNYIFKFKKFNILSIYIYIINYNILKVFVRNNINYIINLSRKIKLKIIINYKIIKYFFINIF